LNKAIWIDLDNSPHVPLFAPVIRHYRARGIEVIITARDHAQTVELLDLHGFAGKYTVVGSHYGKSKINKICGLIVRAKQLVSHIKQLQKPMAVAVSHGSRSMVLAAWWLKIPVVTMYDYEFTETGLFNRFSFKVLVPEAIPDKTLDEIGLKPGKRIKYSGVKEELYIRSFHPQANFRKVFLKERGIGDDEYERTILAVLRPPASSANYHSGKSDVLFDDILHLLANASDIRIAVVPRTPEQAKQITKHLCALTESPGLFIILEEAVNGLDLVSAADLVISGGGTMNREAALLGVPVYSIFAGRLGALDRKMEAEGLITFIRDARDLSKIRLEHRDRQKPNALTDRVEKFLIEQIDAMLG
jgi:uncharacterized protein